VSGVDVSTYAQMPAVGLIVSKSSTTDAVVQVEGEYRTTALVTGRRYFINHLKHLAIAPPDPPSGGRVVVQIVGVALDPTRLLLAPNFSTVTRVG
jgi:hypothetical protein